MKINYFKEKVGSTFIMHFDTDADGAIDRKEVFIFIDTSRKLDGENISMSRMQKSNQFDLTGSGLLPATREDFLKAYTEMKLWELQQISLGNEEAVHFLMTLTEDIIPELPY